MEVMVRTVVELPFDLLDQVEVMAKARGETMTSIIHRALNTESFIFRELVRGNKILVEERDRSIKEVRWSGQ